MLMDHSVKLGLRRGLFQKYKRITQKSPLNYFLDLHKSIIESLTVHGGDGGDLKY